MKQLLSIEYAKLKKLTSIKIIFLCYAVIIPMWMYFMDFFFHQHPGLKAIITDDALFAFPHVWKFTVYSASFFNVLMGVTIVIITCNEIQFKTLRQNVIDGLSKKEAIISKLFVVSVFSFIVTLYTFLTGLVLGGIYSGFDNAFDGIDRILLYLLQTLGYFSFAFLFALVVRRSALSIILFIVYFPVESIAGAFLPKGLYQFFPLKVLADLTPMPFFEKLLSQAEKISGEKIWLLPMEWKIILSLVYSALFFGISYYILKKRDL